MTDFAFAQVYKILVCHITSHVEAYASVVTMEKYQHEWKADAASLEVLAAHSANLTYRQNEFHQSALSGDKKKTQDLWARRRRLSFEKRQFEKLTLIFAAEDDPDTILSRSTLRSTLLLPVVLARK